jgi:hypothetical protein
MSFNKRNIIIYPVYILNWYVCDNVLYKKLNNYCYCKNNTEKSKSE